MLKMKTWLLAPVVAFTLAACGGDDNKTPATASSAAPAAAASGNVLKVAVEPVYPPFVQPLPSGGFEGYDIDVLNAIAEKEGFTVSYTPYPWDILFQQLDSGAADVVAGGLSATEKRKETMDFTDSYDSISLVLAVPKDSPIKTFTDVRDKTVSYQKGTKAAEELAKLQNKAPNEKDATDSAWLTIKAVMGGKDAAIGDSAPFEYYANQYKDTNIRLIYNDNAQIEPIGFVVKKGNTELLAKLNKGLAAMKADGTLDKIHHKWMPNEQQHKNDGHNHAASATHAH
ncbi:transporter substrate-binding domain-containing protein [Alysiella crassa]|uniref:L-cystine-binding protein tcyA n=1 Tax=Alysiella crassa TaxID=153491 RepID=A0A376BV62_9NEIS|nr:transporter substrate-binding domain-containing protein [Alysiella crassa]SSY80224.1 L-cystine-binding protein tcyA precursor [Alysiella crassa]